MDRVYMTFVQATTGSGGWPMSVWLTPDAEAVLRRHLLSAGGAMGTPGVHRRAAARSRGRGATTARRSWQSADARDRAAADVSDAAAGDGGDARCRRARRRPWSSSRRPSTSSAAASATRRSFRGRASCCSCCASTRAPGEAKPRAMVLGTLRAMALGGMRDHIGGGFHRYSVDGGWRVPHFEKMLYDQAQLVLAYLEAAQVSGDAFFAQVAEDTLRYVQREMTDADGGVLLGRGRRQRAARRGGRSRARTQDGGRVLHLVARRDRGGARARQPRVGDALRREARRQRAVRSAGGVRQEEPASTRAKSIAAISSESRHRRRPTWAWPWRAAGSACSRRASSGRGRSSTTRCSPPGTA